MSPETSWQPTIGQCATLACLWEATAPKVGNVHRGADFEDATYPDFATSAVLLGPVLERGAAGTRLGDLVLEAVQTIRSTVGTNTYLGTLLLLAPLCMPPAGASLRDGVAHALAQLDERDSQQVYAAIQLAQPGGLGRADQHDVSGPAPPRLIDAMIAAADRDLVARQYATGFAEVFDFVVPALAEELQRGEPLMQAIVGLQLRIMSQFPDSLIARKCGPETARRSADQAAEVLAARARDADAYARALADFDFWLRADGHRRNPGTTADLVAAGLFIGLRQGFLRPPWRL